MAAAPDDDARRTLAELEAKLRELERELLRGYEPEAVEADPFAAPAGRGCRRAAAARRAAPGGGAAGVRCGRVGGVSAGARTRAAPRRRGRAGSRARAGAARPEPLHAAPSPSPSRLDAPSREPEPEPSRNRSPNPSRRREPEPEPEPRAAARPDALAHAHDLLASLRATIEDMGLTAQRVTAEAQAVADDHGRALGRLARVAKAAARAEEAAVEAGRIAATVVVEAGPFADAEAVTALRDTLAAQPGARDAYVRGVEDGRAVIEVHLAPPPA